MTCGKCNEPRVVQSVVNGARQENGLNDTVNGMNEEAGEEDVVVVEEDVVEEEEEVRGCSEAGEGLEGVREGDQLVSWLRLRLEESEAAAEVLAEELQQVLEE